MNRLELILYGVYYFITTHLMHIMGAFCMIAIIGTAGGADLGTLSTSDALRQTLIYILITFISGCIVFASSKK